MPDNPVDIATKPLTSSTGRWTTALALLGALAVAASGCSSILDFDKFRIDSGSPDGPAADAGDGGADSQPPDLELDLPLKPDLGTDLPAPDVGADLSDGPAPDKAPMEDSGPVDQAQSDADMGPPDAGPETAPDLGPDSAVITPGAVVTIATGSVTFNMGSPTTEPCRPTDTSEDLHQVTLSQGFEMQNTEVTKKQFVLAMGYDNSASTVCTADDCPVTKVSWHEAAAYCNKLSLAKSLAECYACSGSGSSITCADAPAYQHGQIYSCPGYRLPTEAEWEYAARGNTSTSVYQGTINNCTTADPIVDPIAWYASNAKTDPRAVGLKAPNKFGLFDMIGNVSEWTHDRYDANLGLVQVTNPWGPLTGVARSIRGGNFQSQPKFLRAAARASNQPNVGNLDTGFRCVRSL